jgi:hypothetical protein
MEVKGWKTVGNRLSQETVKKVSLKGDRTSAPPEAVKPTVMEQFEEERLNKDQLNLL